MDVLTMLQYIAVFVLGTLVGSFLNVCIFRIPEKGDIVSEPSHCMSCGRRLKWYELIPIVSYLALRGRCRGCKSPISVQYPLIEAGNGILWVVICLCQGLTPLAFLYCLLVSALLVVSVIDARTGEIPFGINIFIFVLGLLRLAISPQTWLEQVIGFFAVSMPLLLVLFATRGRGIGGGDVKLMACCGFLLGWRLIVLAFIAGCILGSVIHLLRMWIAPKTGKVLALGPYLSAGMFLAMICGTALIQWYVNTFFTL